MQALIDFDGWRQWKDSAKKPEEPVHKMSVSYHSVAPTKKANISPTIAAKRPETNGVKKDDDAKEKERERKSKRKSLAMIPPPVLAEEVETPPAEVDSEGS